MDLKRLGIARLASRSEICQLSPSEEPTETDDGLRMTRGLGNRLGILPDRFNVPFRRVTEDTHTLVCLQESIGIVSRHSSALLRTRGAIRRAQRIY